MLISNSTWRIVASHFSETQRQIIMLAVREHPEMHSMRIDESALPQWLANKLSDSVAQVAPGA